jgi:hypothetical protein
VQKYLFYLNQLNIKGGFLKKCGKNPQSNINLREHPNFLDSSIAGKDDHICIYNGVNALKKFYRNEIKLHFCKVSL